MARTVKDAAYLLQAIAGRDPADNYTSAIPFTELPEYVEHCKFDSLRGARIGIPRNMILAKGQNAVVLTAFEEAIATIQAAGADVTDGANVTDSAIADLLDSTKYWKVLSADFLSNLPDLYLSKLTKNPNSIRSVEELRSFTQGHAAEAYPDRDTGVWDDALDQGFGNTDPRFWPLYERSLRIGGPDGVLGVLRNLSLDALIIPTNYASSLSARIGAPVVTVPLGHYPSNHEVIKSNRDLVEIGPNIPFGLSFIGPKWSEAKLISYAYAFEQRTQARSMVSPYIQPDAELRSTILRS